MAAQPPKLTPQGSSKSLSRDEDFAPVLGGFSFSPLVVDNFRALGLHELHQKNEFYLVPPEIMLRVCQDERSTAGGTLRSGNFAPVAMERHGKLSPCADLKWDSQTKLEFKVPAHAYRFAFAYPLAGFKEEAERNHIQLNEDPCLFFVAIGGFIFWDDDGRVCGATALGEGAGLALADSRRLSRRPGREDGLRDHDEDEDRSSHARHWRACLASDVSTASAADSLPRS